MDKKAMLSDNLKYKARLIILAQENKLNTLSGAECRSSAQKPDADRNVGGCCYPVSPTTLRAPAREGQPVLGPQACSSLWTLPALLWGPEGCDVVHHAGARAGHPQ